MDTSKLFVPNAARLINFFKTKKRETISQSGGGPYILPINELSTTAGKSEPKQQLNVEAATIRAEKQVKRRRKMVKRKYIKRKRKGNKTHSTQKVSKKNRRNWSRRKFNNKTKKQEKIK